MERSITGPAANAPFSDVSALVGGASATVISASLMVGQIGVYQVQLEINSTCDAGCAGASHDFAGLDYQ